MPQSPEGDRLFDQVEGAFNDPVQLGVLREKVNGAGLDAEERDQILGLIGFYIGERRAWDTDRLPEGERPVEADAPAAGEAA